jgi:hypothetical protein
MVRDVDVGGCEEVAPFAVRWEPDEEEALAPDGVGGGSVATVVLAIAAVIVPVAVPVGAEGECVVVVGVVVLTLAVVAVFGVERSSDDVRSLPLIDWSSLISTITPCRGRVAVGASATGSGRGCSCSPPFAL